MSDEKQILIVEDNPVYFHWIKAIVEKRGSAVELYDNYKQAAVAIRKAGAAEASYAAAIIDVQLAAAPFDELSDSELQSSQLANRDAGLQLVRVALDVGLTELPILLLSVRGDSDWTAEAKQWVNVTPLSKGQAGAGRTIRKWISKQLGD